MDEERGGLFNTGIKYYGMRGPGESDFGFSPEFGVSEWLARKIGQPVNDQGGSNIIRGQSIPLPSFSGSKQVASSPVGDMSVAGPTSKPKSETPTLPPSGDTGGDTGGGGGGGGGDTELQQLEKMGARNPIQEQRYQELLAQARGGYDEERRLIDEAYGASASHLNAFEESLRRNFPSILEEARQMYEAQLAQAEAGRRQGVEQISESGELARQSARDLENRQARTFSEMLTGAQQRFGTESNVGQASRAILGQEFQRESAMTQRELMNTQRQLEQEQRRVNENFQVQQQQLAATRDQAISTARREFDQRLLEISQNRALLEGQKAQAKLGALQDLRNRILQVNMQQVQFEQALEQQRQEAMLNLEMFQRQLAASNQAQSSTLENALGTFGQDVNAPTVNYLAGSSENDPRFANYRGQIGNADDDFLQGIISRAGQLLPGRDELNQ